jgi:hypothetical protein
MVDERGLKSFPRYFAAGDHFSGCTFDGGVGGFDADFGFVFVGGAIQCDHDQAFGFHLGRAAESQISFHGVDFQYRRRTGKCARQGTV